MPLRSSRILLTFALVAIAALMPACSSEGGGKTVKTVKAEAEEGLKLETRNTDVRMKALLVRSGDDVRVRLTVYNESSAEARVPAPGVQLLLSADGTTPKVLLVQGAGKAGDVLVLRRAASKAYEWTVSVEEASENSRLSIGVPVSSQRGRGALTVTTLVSEIPDAD